MKPKLFRFRNCLQNNKYMHTYMHGMNAYIWLQTVNFSSLSPLTFSLLEIFMANIVSNSMLKCSCSNVGREGISRISEEKYIFYCIITRETGSALAGNIKQNIFAIGHDTPIIRIYTDNCLNVSSSNTNNIELRMSWYTYCLIIG